MNILRRMEDYSDLGSWAIWESTKHDRFETEDDMNENIQFEKYVGKFQPSNYVLLAMNPGGIFDQDKAKQSTRKSSHNKRRWANFHNIGKSRDYLLAAAVMETKLHGSYMTDFFPFIGSDSKAVERFVKAPDNADVIDRLIHEFDDEMNCLLPNQNEIILICLSRLVEKWSKKYLVKNPNLQKKYTIYYFPHYSPVNTHVSSKKDSDKYYPKEFRKKIVEYQLDL